MPTATLPEQSFTLGTYPAFVEASDASPRRVLNAAGSTIYYSTARTVGSGDTAVTVGGEVTLTNSQWIISASSSKVLVFASAPDFLFDDITADTITPTGGVVPISQPSQIVCDTGLPRGATEGTDTAFANGTSFVTSVFVPTNFTATSIGYLVGSVGGTTKIIARIYNSAGALVASSTTTSSGTTAGTAAQLQEIALTATAALTGPRRYFIAISGNGTTAKLRTVAAYTGGGAFTGSVALAHAATTAITPPSAFAADTGPYCYII